MAPLFRRKKSFTGLISTTDLHSHLLPGIDDGVQSLEESLEVIMAFKKLGYTKLITTPHIMYDHYKNDPIIINNKLADVRKALSDNSIDIEIEAAAEYYLDEYFLDLLNTDKKFLTFGKNYLLFELSFMSKPLILKEAIFMMQTKGFIPVLAHPERYLYFQNDLDSLKEIHENGVLLQLNLLSLSGYYSKPARKLSNTLIKENMISFIGSDCHNLNHLNSLSETLNSSVMNSLLSQNLLNNSI
ncbi:MAG: CpsB/CapC family capsule biosynthesis tyrosine phosphatase [Bacteroidota bacterium]